MNERIYQPGESYAYPLILKKLLNTPLIYAPEKEIVYCDGTRYTYKDLNHRIQRLADGLNRLGVQQGDVVAVLDYDSPRYLECFFAIPMMGAVLQTANWRLSSEQIVYTINHAEAKMEHGTFKLKGHVKRRDGPDRLSFSSQIRLEDQPASDFLYSLDFEKKAPQGTLALQAELSSQLWLCQSYSSRLRTKTWLTVQAAIVVLWEQCHS